MVKIIEETFLTMATNFLLTQRVVEHIINHLGESLTGGNLKDMFASENSVPYAEQLILSHIEREIGRRKKINLVDNESMQH